MIVAPNEKQSREDVIRQVFKAVPHPRKFVLWGLEGITKVPYSPVDFQGSLKRAGTNRPNEWGTLTTCLALIARGVPVVGLGYCFEQTDGWVGVDFDDCVEDGQINEIVMDALKDLNSYAEISPSGTGVKVFLKAAFSGPPCNFLLGYQRVEIYSHHRFFAITGNHIQGTPLEVAAREEAFSQWFNHLTPDSDGEDLTSYSFEVSTDDYREALENTLRFGSHFSREKAFSSFLADHPGTQSGSNEAEPIARRLIRKGLFSFLVQPDKVLEAMATWGEKPSNTNDTGDYYPWEKKELARKITYVLAKQMHLAGHLGAALTLDSSKVDQIITPLPEHPEIPEQYQYLYCNNHTFLTEKERTTRKQKIRQALDLLPPQGFFRNYLRYWLPCSDCPVIFHLASSLATAAHFLNRRVYLRNGSKITYPTLWVSLLAGSSKLRKSTAISCAKQTIRRKPEFAASILPDSFTGELLLQELGCQLFDSETIEQKRLWCHDQEAMLPNWQKGVGFLHIDELGGFLANLEKQYNQGVKEMITSLWDNPPDHLKKTKTAGSFYLYKPCVSILAASTISWLNDNAKQGDLDGGFFPRWAFFVEKEKDYILSLPDLPDESVATLLDEDIDQLCQIAGEMVFTPEGKKFYHSWRKQIELDAPDQMAGWINRLGDVAVKIAMIYSAARGSLLIDEESLKLACALVDRIAQNLGDLLEYDLAFSEFEAQTKRVLSLLRDKKRIKRSDLLRLSHLKSRELDDVLKVMESSVDEHQLSRGGMEYRYCGS